MEKPCSKEPLSREEIAALAKRRKKIGWFITKEGLVQKAVLKNILPLFRDEELRRLLKDINKCEIWIKLPRVLAHLSYGLKDLFYRNLSPRLSAELKKQVEEAEAEINGPSSKWEREKLLNFIKYQKMYIWKRANLTSNLMR